MASAVEYQSIINSFHAVDYDTGQIIQADDQGFIEPAIGQVIGFENPANDKDNRVEVTSFIVTTKDKAVKLSINDNEKYPFYVGKNTTKGLDAIYVSKIKVLETGPFYYDALTNRT